MGPGEEFSKRRGDRRARKGSDRPTQLGTAPTTGCPRSAPISAGSRRLPSPMSGRGSATPRPRPAISDITPFTAATWLAQVPLWPHSFSFAAECALTNRDPGLADEQLTAGFRILPADDPMLLSLQSVLCACRGEKSAALECVHKSLKSPWPFQHIHHASHQVARTYAALGDLDKAVAWLQRAAETGFPC